MPEHILFLTGRLAEPRLRRLLGPIAAADPSLIPVQREALGERGALGAGIATPGFQIWNEYFEGGIVTLSYLAADRPALLQGATLALYLSRAEGFGMPIVEANAVGRPVVTSNILSMPEVAGDAACFVDPFTQSV